jgi:hypothetical protein
MEIFKSFYLLVALMAWYRDGNQWSIHEAASLKPTSCLDTLITHTAAPKPPPYFLFKLKEPSGY